MWWYVIVPYKADAWYRSGVATSIQMPRSVALKTDQSKSFVQAITRNQVLRTPPTLHERMIGHASCITPGCLLLIQLDHMHTWLHLEGG